MPFVYFGIGWLIGIWAASALQLPTEVLLAFTIVPMIGLALWRSDRRATLIWISAVFAIAGSIRYNLSIPHFDQNSLSTYNNSGEVTIDGVISDLIARPEFATFSYQDFLARQGIYSMIDRPRIVILDHDQGSPIFAAILAFRGRAREVITQILPEPQASLLNGILLGDDSGLPADVQDEFRRTGTTHIIAI